jgi:hypothetical protein
LRTIWAFPIARQCRTGSIQRSIPSHCGTSAATAAWDRNAEHADATLLVNAAGFYVPKTFLDHDGFYDSYLELNRAMFFLTQTVVRGMVEAGGGGAIGATPSSAYSMAKAGDRVGGPDRGQGALAGPGNRRGAGPDGLIGGDAPLSEQFFDVSVGRRSDQDRLIGAGRHGKRSC